MSKDANKSTIDAVKSLQKEINVNAEFSIDAKNAHDIE